jgi:DNA-binding response OmpR family regulator
MGAGFSFLSIKRSGERSGYGPAATLVRGLDSPGHTVLVVDDDPSIRLLCRLNLELDGWRVREAATLAQARDELAHGDVDVLVLDVHVGSGNGVEFLGEIRRERPGLRVAMLTGSDALAAVDSDAVIPKPFTIEQLTGTVAGLAARPARTAG